MKKSLLGIIILFSPFILQAQDDLLADLEKGQKKDNVSATFKGTRLVNGHSIETRSTGTLEMIFAHRFGAINGGPYEMFGLDNAYVRLGLDYGITDDLNVLFGRNSVDKTWDAYVKYKALKQRQGGMPVTITALGGMAFITSPNNATLPPNLQIKAYDRIAYIGQVHIARKFSQAVSIQVSPTVVHKNMVDQTIENNQQYALGIGGRIKVSGSVALTTEYYYRFAPMGNDPYYNSFGLGIDIETGGHVFQLVITNTQGLTERAFISETLDNFATGGLHLGFNVTRAFQVSHKKPKPN